MATDLKALDISGLPEVARLADEVRATGQSRVLVRGEEEVAVIAPPPKRRRQAPRAKASGATRPNAWLEPLIGQGSSARPESVARNVHQYVARAIYGDAHPARER